MDTVDATLLRTEFDEGHIEWCLFNAQGSEIQYNEFHNVNEILWNQLIFPIHHTP